MNNAKNSKGFKGLSAYLHAPTLEAETQNNQKKIKSEEGYDSDLWRLLGFLFIILLIFFLLCSAIQFVRRNISQSESENRVSSTGLNRSGSILIKAGYIKSDSYDKYIDMAYGPLSNFSTKSSKYYCRSYAAKNGFSYCMKKVKEDTVHTDDGDITFMLFQGNSFADLPVVEPGIFGIFAFKDGKVLDSRLAIPTGSMGKVWIDEWHLKKFGTSSWGYFADSDFAGGMAGGRRLTTIILHKGALKFGSLIYNYSEEFGTAFNYEGFYEFLDTPESSTGLYDIELNLTGIIKGEDIYRKTLTAKYDINTNKWIMDDGKVELPQYANPEENPIYQGNLFHEVLLSPPEKLTVFEMQ